VRRALAGAAVIGAALIAAPSALAVTCPPPATAAIVCPPPTGGGGGQPCPPQPPPPQPPPPEPPVPLAAPPSSAALHTFALLRRAARPADAWPRPDLLPSGVTFDPHWSRLARKSGGYRFFLLPGNPNCDSSKGTLLYIGAVGQFSSVSGGATVHSVRRFGEWSAQGTSRGSIVSGLLPDGVAKVTVTYPKGRGHPGGVRYRHAFRKTVRVRHNMAVFRIGRTPDDAASPARQVWRSKSGRVIRRARGNP
jgi:hypothetical protein